MDYKDAYSPQEPVPPNQQSWVEADAGQPVSTGKNWWPTCLIGCLGFFVLMVILAGIGGYLAATKGPAMAAKFVRNQVADQIQSSDLPADEKDEIVRQLDRLVVAFENGELSPDDLERVGRELAKSPIVIAGVLKGVEEQYLKPSGLSDDEKEEARKAIQRIWRGAIEKKIDPDELQPALETIADKKGENKWELKSKLTDEELREFVSILKSVADEHEIPDESFDVQISEEVRRLVDELLGEDTSSEKSDAGGNGSEQDSFERNAPQLQTEPGNSAA